MRLFVSCERVDCPPAALLIARLREEGWEVDHSPRNPLDGPDPRWSDWYSRGLREALAAATVFIIVVTPGWDSSTWMAQEACLAIQENSRCRVADSFYWNPDQIQVRAAGVLPYLTCRLPDVVDEVLARLHRLEAQTGGIPKARDLDNSGV